MEKINKIKGALYGAIIGDALGAPLEFMPQEQIKAVCIGPDDDMEVRRSEILNKVSEVDKGSGAIVLTDMFVGTPSNLAISIMDKAKVEIIAGINLPMLIKLASLRKDKNLKDAVEGAQEAGKKYINVASKLLGM